MQASKSNVKLEEMKDGSCDFFKKENYVVTLHEQLSNTIADRNLEKYLDLLHEEFTVTFHKSGNSFSKKEWESMVKGMLANEKFIHESSRCVYENDDILIQHNFMSYPDNTREAVMLVAVLKDGKIFRMESGATPLD